MAVHCPITISTLFSAWQHADFRQDHHPWGWVFRYNQQCQDQNSRQGKSVHGVFLNLQVTYHCVQYLPWSATSHFCEQVDSSVTTNNVKAKIQDKKQHLIFSGTWGSSDSCSPSSQYTLIFKAIRPQWRGRFPLRIIIFSALWQASPSQAQRRRLLTAHARYVS